MEITFRPLGTDDLPTLHGWLNDPAVVEWWEGDDVSWEAVRRDYDPDGPDSTEHWVAVVDGVATGWIQCYPAADEPEETAAWLPLGVHEHAAGIDYLIGRPGDRGRGVGSAMIGAFVDQVVFGRHPAWTQACAGPYVANAASWKALAGAGFRHVGDVTHPGDAAGPCRLMIRDRPVP